MASTVLTKTSTTVTDDKKLTISTWCKRSALSNSGVYGLLGHKDSANPGNSNLQLYFNGDLLYFAFRSNNGADTHIQYITNQVFRDTSAWYHIVASVDSTQATAGDRVTMWLNGEEITSFQTETNPPLNRGFLNASSDIYVGKVVGTTGTDYYFDGLQAHTHYCDGYAYSASDFGETDATSSIWKPKVSPSVTYGNNGFFLKFGNAGSLGTDSSGNANNFTLSGSGTQTLDTPSNVFATWNSLIKTAATFSNGNTSLNNTSTPYKGSMATIVPTQGKWYAEIKAVDATTAQIGFITADTLLDGDRSLYSSSSNIYWQTNVTTIKYYLNSVLQGDATVTGGTNSVPTYTDNDIIMLAMDLDNGYGWFGKNGTWENSGNPATGTNAFNLASDYANGTTFFAGALNANLAANFGNGYFGTTAVSTPESDSAGLGKFEYSVPTGYYALCTKNIADYG